MEAEKARQKLFKHIYNEHGLNLIEANEIMRLVENYLDAKTIEKIKRNNEIIHKNNETTH